MTSSIHKRKVNERIVGMIVDEQAFVKFMIRSHILAQKTTKTHYSKEVLDMLVAKIWCQFLKDCKNEHIGITKALEIVFKSN